MRSRDNWSFNAASSNNPYPDDDLYTAAARCFNILRALHVKQGRTRQDDESVIPYFVNQPSYHPSEIQTLDVTKFRALLDNYYTRRGWDKATGYPTRATLEGLGLKDVADELNSLGKLPSYREPRAF